VASVARVAHQVDPTGELHVEPSRARFQTDRHTAFARQPRIEARADEDGRRERGRALVVRSIARIGDTHAGIAALYRRDAQTRDSGCVARAGVLEIIRDALVARYANRWHGPDETDDEREPLLVGHLLLDLSRALVRGCCARRRDHSG